MNQRSDLPCDLINAFVDGELSSEERARLLEAADERSEIADHICQIRMMKDMLRVAYQDLPSPARKGRSRWSSASWLAQAAAAVLLLTLGGSAGWYANAELATSALPELAAHALRIDPARADTAHVLLHISTADARRVGAALSGAEELLASYQRDHKPLVVEVIVNAEGIQILRADTSAYVARIRDLTRRYSNISFVACSRSLERLHLKGTQVHLIKEAHVIPEALDAIIHRLKQGWIYIQA